MSRSRASFVAERPQETSKCTLLVPQQSIFFHFFPPSSPLLTFCFLSHPLQVNAVLRTDLLKARMARFLTHTLAAREFGQALQLAMPKPLPAPGSSSSSSSSSGSSSSSSNAQHGSASVHRSSSHSGASESSSSSAAAGAAAAANDPRLRKPSSQSHQPPSVHQRAPLPPSSAAAPNYRANPANPVNSVNSANPGSAVNGKHPAAPVTAAGGGRPYAVNPAIAAGRPMVEQVRLAAADARAHGSAPSSAGSARPGSSHSSASNGNGRESAAERAKLQMERQRQLQELVRQESERQRQRKAQEEAKLAEARRKRREELERREEEERKRQEEVAQRLREQRLERQRVGERNSAPPVQVPSQVPSQVPEPSRRPINSERRQKNEEERQRAIEQARRLREQWVAERKKEWAEKGWLQGLDMENPAVPGVSDAGGSGTGAGSESDAAAGPFGPLPDVAALSPAEQQRLAIQQRVARARNSTPEAQAYEEALARGRQEVVERRKVLVEEKERARRRGRAGWSDAPSSDASVRSAGTGDPVESASADEAELAYRAAGEYSRRRQQELQDKTAAAQIDLYRARQEQERQRVFGGAAAMPTDPSQVRASSRSSSDASKPSSAEAAYLAELERVRKEVYLERKALLDKKKREEEQAYEAVLNKYPHLQGDTPRSSESRDPTPSSTPGAAPGTGSIDPPFRSPLAAPVSSSSPQSKQEDWESDAELVKARAEAQRKAALRQEEERLLEAHRQAMLDRRRIREKLMAEQEKEKQERSFVSVAEDTPASAGSQNEGGAQDERIKSPEPRRPEPQVVGKPPAVQEPIVFSPPIAESKNPESGPSRVSVQRVPMKDSDGPSGADATAKTTMPMHTVALSVTESNFLATDQRRLIEEMEQHEARLAAEAARARNERRMMIQKFKKEMRAKLLAPPQTIDGTPVDSVGIEISVAYPTPSSASAKTSDLNNVPIPESGSTKRKETISTTITVSPSSPGPSTRTATTATSSNDLGSSIASASNLDMSGDGTSGPLIFGDDTLTKAQRDKKAEMDRRMRAKFERRQRERQDRAHEATHAADGGPTGSPLTSLADKSSSKATPAPISTPGSPSAGSIVHQQRATGAAGAASPPGLAGSGPKAVFALSGRRPSVEYAASGSPLGLAFSPLPSSPLPSNSSASQSPPGHGGSSVGSHGSSRSHSEQHGSSYASQRSSASSGASISSTRAKVVLQSIEDTRLQLAALNKHTGSALLPELRHLRVQHSMASAGTSPSSSSSSSTAVPSASALSPTPTSPPKPAAHAHLLPPSRKTSGVPTVLPSLDRALPHARYPTASSPPAHTQSQTPTRRKAQNASTEVAARPQSPCDPLFRTPEQLSDLAQRSGNSGEGEEELAKSLLFAQQQADGDMENLGDAIGAFGEEEDATLTEVEGAEGAEEPENDDSIVALEVEVEGIRDALIEALAEGELSISEDDEDEDDEDEEDYDPDKPPPLTMEEILAAFSEADDAGFGPSVDSEEYWNANNTSDSEDDTGVLDGVAGGSLGRGSGAESAKNRHSSVGIAMKGPRHGRRNIQSFKDKDVDLWEQKLLEDDEEEEGVDDFHQGSMYSSGDETTRAPEAGKQSAPSQNGTHARPPIESVQSISNRYSTGSYDRSRAYLAETSTSTIIPSERDSRGGPGFLVTAETDLFVSNDWDGEFHSQIDNDSEDNRSVHDEKPASRPSRSVRPTESQSQAHDELLSNSLLNLSLTHTSNLSDALRASRRIVLSESKKQQFFNPNDNSGPFDNYQSSDANPNSRFTPKDYNDTDFSDDGGIDDYKPIGVKGN